MTGHLGAHDDQQCGRMRDLSPRLKQIEDALFATEPADKQRHRGILRPSELLPRLATFIGRHWRKAREVDAVRNVVHPAGGNAAALSLGHELVRDADLGIGAAVDRGVSAS